MTPDWITWNAQLKIFLKEQGAHELGLDLCTADRLYRDTYYWGLIRTMTLAEGYETCDFRFKRIDETRIAVPVILSQMGDKMCKHPGWRGKARLEQR